MIATRKPDSDALLAQSSATISAADIIAAVARIEFDPELETLHAVTSRGLTPEPDRRPATGSVPDGDAPGEPEPPVVRPTIVACTPPSAFALPVELGERGVEVFERSAGEIRIAGEAVLEPESAAATLSLRRPPHHWIPPAASFFVPGLGQVLNSETRKARTFGWALPVMALSAACLAAGFTPAVASAFGGGVLWAIGVYDAGLIAWQKDRRRTTGAR